MESIKNLLIKGKLKDAIESITLFAEGSEYESVIITLYQTLESVNRESMAGLLTMEAERTERAKITAKILKLAADLVQLNSVKPDNLRVIPNSNVDKRLTG